MDDRKETPLLQEKPTSFRASPGWAAARKVIRIVVGVILIILGLLALFTPFTPGSWLAVIGLEFLGLRVLLRNKTCAWAAAKPQSRIRKAACRVLAIDGFGRVKRRWQRRRGEPRP